MQVRRTLLHFANDGHNLRLGRYQQAITVPQLDVVDKFPWQCSCGQLIKIDDQAANSFGTSKLVEQGIFRLIENELKRLMITNVREEFAFKVIDPAVPAETDDFARPKRAMIIGLGIVGGFFLSILVPLLAASAPFFRDLARP